MRGYEDVTDEELDQYVLTRLEMLGVDLSVLPEDDSEAPADQRRILASARRFLRSTPAAISRLRDGRTGCPAGRVSSRTPRTDGGVMSRTRSVPSIRPAHGCGRRSPGIHRAHDRTDVSGGARRGGPSRLACGGRGRIPAHGRVALCRDPRARQTGLRGGAPHPRSVSHEHSTPRSYSLRSDQIAFDNPAELSVAEAAALIRDGRLKPSALVEACLARIREARRYLHGVQRCDR